MASQSPTVAITAELLDSCFSLVAQQVSERAGVHHDWWFVTRNWATIRADLLTRLRSGTYRLDQQVEYTFDKKPVVVWGVIDRIVLRCAVRVLTPMLAPELSEHCYHVAGSGGLKAGVEKADRLIQKHRFVGRFDVKRYYASINHDLLIQQCNARITDPMLRQIISDYCRRIVWKKEAGWHERIDTGIPLRGSLSPLLGAVYLQSLDKAMAQKNIGYVSDLKAVSKCVGRVWQIRGNGGIKNREATAAVVNDFLFRSVPLRCHASGCACDAEFRSMDDWVITAETRHQMNRAIKTMHKILDSLKLTVHPDKRFIGKTEKGFEFLGHRLIRGRPRGIAGYSYRRALVRAFRLHQQGASKEAIRKYLNRWRRWAPSALKHSTLKTLEQLWAFFRLGTWILTRYPGLELRTYGFLQGADI